MLQSDVNSDSTYLKAIKILLWETFSISEAKKAYLKDPKISQGRYKSISCKVRR